MMLILWRLRFRRRKPEIVLTEEEKQAIVDLAVAAVTPFTVKDAMVTAATR
jgi:hypothetical protein